MLALLLFPGRSRHLYLFFPKVISSAARPPRALQMSSKICSVVVILLSSGRYHAAPRDLPLGTIVTFTRVCDVLKAN